MNKQLDQILELADHLTPDDRAELATRLLEGLHGKPDAEVQAKWDQEALRRLARIKSGESETIPWESVRAELER